MSNHPTGAPGGLLARCRVESPLNLVGYYAPGHSQDDQPDALQTYASLIKRLDGDRSDRLSATQTDEIRARFLAAVERFRDQEIEIARQSHQAHVASLEEAIRQHLLQAAHVELAQAANRGLFDEGEDIPLDFSEDAIRRLSRHKIPFAGALKLVDVTGLRPRPDDPKYIRLRDSYPDVLPRKFEAIKIKLRELLSQLVQAKRVVVGGDGSVGATTGLTVEVY